MSASIITLAELETTRSAADFLPWVKSALDRFSTKPLRQEARAGKHFAQELTEELLPIGWFARGYFRSSPEVLIRWVSGNQAHDAVVDDQRAQPGSVKYVEVTLADHDYEDAKRMELLNLQGHAPSYGPIMAKGPRHRRSELRAELVAVDHDELVAEHLQRATAAVTRKAAKNYPTGTSLILRVDGTGPFCKPDDRTALDDLAVASFVPLLRGREFAALAIVGGNDLFLSYQL